MLKKTSPSRLDQVSQTIGKESKRLRVCPHLQEALSLSKQVVLCKSSSSSRIAIVNPVNDSHKLEADQGKKDMSTSEESQIYRTEDSCFSD